jgi:hypothetical protein
MVVPEYWSKLFLSSAVARAFVLADIIQTNLRAVPVTAGIKKVKRPPILYSLKYF